MNRYVALLRGINVGGKNKISMTQLRQKLEAAGLENVASYINSGNILFRSDTESELLGPQIESVLTENFKLDSEIIRVLVLSDKQLKDVLENKPKNFGDHPEKYHYDVIFLIDIEENYAMQYFSPRAGVDKIWCGKGVIYSQRLSALRTKSRLSKIASSPIYKSMTIRSWSTTNKLINLLSGD